MKVKCLRDNTIFDAIISPYPTERQTRFMDKDGDKYIECPTCGRRYFHYNEGKDLQDVEPKDRKVGWHVDRPLIILES